MIKMRIPRSWVILSACCLASALGGCAPRGQTAPELRGSDQYVAGAMAYREGDRERAIAALQSAIAENPNLIMARFLLGQVYKDDGRLTAAAEQFERVVELDPYSYANHYHLGLVYHLLDRLQEAAASYLQALKLNPGDMKSNMYLALVYTALGKPEAGLPHAKKAAELAPRDGEAQANLAVVLDAVGDYPQAELAYRRAIELEPNKIENAINLAGNLVIQKRYKEAANIYEQLLKTNNTSLVHQRYGYALLQSGQLDAAYKQFTAALELEPRNFHAMNGMGDVLLSQYRQSAMLDEGKRTQAVAHWRRSLEVNPNQPRVVALVKEFSAPSLFPQ